MTTATLTTQADAGALPAAGRLGQKRRRFRENRVGWAFTAPFLVVFALFLVWPVIYGFYLSLTGQSLTGANGGFIGVTNYLEAFRDADMWHSLGNTVIFTVASTIPLVVIALILALLVHLGLPGQWLWRLAFFLPYLLASTVVSLFWVWMYNPSIGFINEMLTAIGLPASDWLNDQNTAMMAIVIATVWWTVGFNFLLYLAALQNIPEQQFEAAALDGAGKWRQLFSITIPQLGPTTGLIVILQILASLKVFDQVYQMTSGGPAGATRPILEYVFEAGFTGYRLGYSSAISYIFFAIIVIVSLLQFRFVSRRHA